MEHVTVTRPPQPESPGQGLVYVAVPDPEWRVAGAGARCRRRLAVETLACGEQAVAEKHHPNDPISPWWPYCARDTLGYGLADRRRVEDAHWVEDGKVMHYALRKRDGTVPTRAEAGRALRNWQATAALTWRSPAESTPLSMRVRRDLRDGARGAAAGAGTDVSTWIRQAMQARLGYLRCETCREDAPPVPLEFGDLTGKPLDEWIAETVEQVRRQHPRHEPVRVGAVPERGDLVPALLSRGGIIEDEEQAERLGLGRAFRQQQAASPGAVPFRPPPAAFPGFSGDSRAVKP
jgi:hypothetical protein